MAGGGQEKRRRMASRPLSVKKLLGLKNLISMVPLSLLSRMLTVSSAFLEESKGMRSDD